MICTQESVYWKVVKMLSREEIDQKYKRLTELAQELKNSYDMTYDVKRELGRIQQEISTKRTELLTEVNDKVKHPDLKNADLREAFIKKDLTESGKSEERRKKEEEIMKWDCKVKSIEAEFRAIRVILETEAQLVSVLYGKDKGY